MAGNSGRGELDGLVPHGRPPYDRRHQERPHQARGHTLEVGQNRVAESNITPCRRGRVLVRASIDASLPECVKFVLACISCKQQSHNLIISLSYHISTHAVCKRGFTESSILGQHFATNGSIQVTSKTVSSPKKLLKISREDPIATISWQSLDSCLVC